MERLRSWKECFLDRGKIRSLSCKMGCPDQATGICKLRGDVILLKIGEIDGNVVRTRWSRCVCKVLEGTVGNVALSPTSKAQAKDQNASQQQNHDISLSPS